MRITKRNVDALKPSGRRRYLDDDKLDGFGVVVQPSGTKTCIFEYRAGAGGRTAPERRYTIGRHDRPWTADMAREEAERLRAAVIAGDDPAATKTAQRQCPDADHWFAAVARDHLELHGQKLRPSTRRDYGYVIAHDLEPA